MTVPGRADAYLGGRPMAVLGVALRQAVPGARDPRLYGVVASRLRRAADAQGLSVDALARWVEAGPGCPDGPAAAQASAAVARAKDWELAVGHDPMGPAWARAGLTAAEAARQHGLPDGHPDQVGAHRLAAMAALRGPAAGAGWSGR